MIFVVVLRVDVVYGISFALFLITMNGCGHSCQEMIKAPHPSSILRSWRKPSVLAAISKWKCILAHLFTPLTCSFKNKDTFYVAETISRCIIRFMGVFSTFCARAGRKSFCITVPWDKPLPMWIVLEISSWSGERRGEASCVERTPEGDSVSFVDRQMTLSHFLFSSLKHCSIYG